MGKKIQEPSSSRFIQIKPLSLPPSAEVASASEPPNPPAESLDPVIFREGSQIQEAMKRGNYFKAFQMVKKSVCCHQDSPHFFNLIAVALQFLAKTAAKDSKEMVDYLDKAYQSVQFAVMSMPHSIHFASCEVAILYLKALFNGKYWAKAIQICNSALNLKIENLTDPGVDKFLQENEMGNSSKELRIENERRMISQYLHLCKDEKKLTGMKVQVEKANKKIVENADGTLQEMVTELERIRKKLEAVIENWRTFKQIKTQYGMEKYYDGNEEKKEKYKSFWGALSEVKKTDFCKVSIKDLERHSKSINCHLAGNVFREAIEFAKEHKTWKCWECCDCDKKFGDLELYRKHFRELHLKNLDGIKLQSWISCEVIELIENREWKPLDAKWGIMTIMNKIKSESFSSSDICLFDENSLNDSESSSIEETVQDFVYITIDENESSSTSEEHQKWQFDDDTCAAILNSVQWMFHLLLKKECLAPTFLHWAIQYTVEKFEDLLPFSRCLELEAIMIICLLGAVELRQVHEFLKDLAETCGLMVYQETGSTKDDKLLIINPELVIFDTVFDFKQRVEISDDLTSLLLDVRFLAEELNLTNDFEDVVDNNSAVTFDAIVCENEIVPESVDFVSWLYEGPTIQFVMKSWSSLKDSQRLKAKEFFQIFLKEYSQVERLCESDFNRVHRITLEAIQAVESIFPKEIEKGDKSMAQSYVRLLRKRQKELESNDDISSQLQKAIIYEVISDILNRARAVKRLAASWNKTGFQSFAEEDELKMLEHFETAEIFARSTLQKIRLRSLKEQAFVDAIIFRAIGAIKQHESKLEMMSSYDYRSMILPLLKSFLQTNLEDLFDKDVTAKYDATAEALVEKNDDRKKFGKVCDNVREKIDKKKKNNKKKFRKEKKPKAVDCIETFQLHQNDAEKEDTPKFEIGVSASAEDMREWTVIEEKQLEEQVEKQRNFENECAEKRSQADAEKVVGLNLEVSDSSEKRVEMTKNKIRRKKKNFRKDWKSKAGSSSVNFQLHQCEAEQVASANCESGVYANSKELTESTVIEDLGRLIVIEAKQLEELAQNQRKIENESADKRRFKADVEKAVCLSLDSFEKHHGFLSTDVRNGSTPRFDVHQYVIIQSQWRLRQLRDESMSRSEIYHTHAGNPCFLCALQDSFAVMHIASRIMPEVAFVPVPSRKLPVNFFFKDWLNSEDVPESEHSYELKQQLVAEVMKIVEELEAERNRKNEAKQEDLSEHKMDKRGLIFEQASRWGNCLLNQQAFEMKLQKHSTYKTSD